MCALAGVKWSVIHDATDYSGKGVSMPAFELQEDILNIHIHNDTNQSECLS